MRQIIEGIYQLRVIDWDRRLFDALIPIPDGTSYNAYLIHGSEKTVLLDTVDSSAVDVIQDELKSIDTLDYVVIHHAEQDHSGAIPFVLREYPECRIVTTSKCQSLLLEFYNIEEDRFTLVKDGDRLDLGDRHLEFLFTPWVHWPETMLSYLPQEGILFTCDLFGSHLATSDLFASDKMRVYEAAKRYYAGIMMPYSNKIAKYLKRLSDLDISMIAPSHGPIYDDPAFIMDAYHEWILGQPKNLVVLPYISMHGSTRQMVDILCAELIDRGVAVQPFDLTEVDIGRLAQSLVDAATIVFATPAFLNGAHPNVVHAAHLSSLLKPKAKHASVICSMGWGGNAADQITEMLAKLKLEIIDPVVCKGVPDMQARQNLANLAETIAQKNKLTIPEM